MSIKNEKQLAQEWLKMTENIRKATPVDRSERSEAKNARIKRLEADPEAWIKYYFPKYSFAPPAKFHIASTRRLVNAVRAMKIKGSGKFYQSRAWARGLAKSTRRMLEIFYISFAKKFPTNMLLCSKSYDNAVQLLSPYRANLEANQRLINDYGKQQNLGSWEAGKFITGGGLAFRAVGADQNPRGSKNEEVRVNVAGFDDIDDDEVSRNPDRVTERWTWIEKAVIPTVEISKPYIIFFDNNIIAEDCLALRARDKANDKEIINIRDDEGKSTWPEKNTEEMIDEMLANISSASAQGEYFNNPMSDGNTFQIQKWDKCPPLSEMQFVVIYTDPSSGNKDKPTAKSGNKNSRKAVFVVGRKGVKYYIYKGYLRIMGSAKLIECMYACRDYVGKQTVCYNYIENNTLQDPIYSQIYLPLIYSMGKDNKNGILGIIPDTRKKGEKWTRIEADLESPNRLGNLIFNIDEANDPDMKELAAEFKAAKPSSMLDGCDCIQGAKTIIDEKLVTNDIGSYEVMERERSKSKYY